MSSRRRLSLAALPLAVLLAVAGCSSGDDGGDEPAAAPETAGSAAEPSADDDASPSPSAASSSARPDGPALASREGDLSGHPGTLEVLSLRRSGTLVTLDLRLTNDDAAGSMGLSGGPFGRGVTDNTLRGVSLVDGENSKRHVPVEDAEGDCLCSGTLTSLGAGESILLSATYAAPPDDVRTVTIDTPRFGSFADVPIED